MAVSDVIANVVAVPGSTEVHIRPPVGEEWVIHNLYWSGGCAIWLNNVDVGLLPLTNENNSGSLQNACFNLTNSQFIIIMPLADASIGYDGRRTK